MLIRKEIPYFIDILLLT